MDLVTSMMGESLGRKQTGHNFKEKYTSRLHQVQPDHPHTAQIPQLIMKINSASYLFEKAHYFRSQRDPGFIFFTLVPVSRS